VVEAFDFCPFARGARSSGQVAQRVLDGPAPEVGHALEQIAELEAQPQTVIGLLIFPRLTVAAEGFDRFVHQLREADGARRKGRPPFALAAFHPEGVWGDDTPDRMVMFFRRSPDPTIQLVRFSTLDAVKGPSRSDGKFLFDFSASGLAELERRANEVPLSDRIARTNFERARRDLARVEAVLADIRADRDRSYARFAGG
jgi:hypothetical protein